jgi:hypothetical protein
MVELLRHLHVLRHKHNGPRGLCRRGPFNFSRYAVDNTLDVAYHERDDQ